MGLLMANTLKLEFEFEAVEYDGLGGAKYFKVLHTVCYDEHPNEPVREHWEWTEVQTLEAFNDTS